MVLTKCYEITQLFAEANNGLVSSTGGVLRTGDRWKIQIEIGLMFVLTPLALQIGMQGLMCNSQWNKMIVFLLLCLSTWSDIVCSSHKFYCISVQFSVVLSINLWHGLVLQRCQSLLNIQSCLLPSAEGVRKLHMIIDVFDTICVTVGQRVQVSLRKILNL